MVDVDVLGDYLLIEQIGTGGMARTFRALSTRASTHVCLKVLHPHLADDDKSVKMFIDEATICENLNHPNIVRLLDYGRVDGRYFIALELVLGNDLKAVLEEARARDRAMSPALCVEVVIAVLRALDYIHNKAVGGERLDIIHRDVTPHNVMLAFDGGVKLTDFGVAKAAFRMTQTTTGSIKGKYGYMSPEQVRGKDVDGRSDVFAAGIVLHEMLAGEHLFQGESPYVTIANLVSKDIPPPSTVNPAVDGALDRIIFRALERDRELRYGSAGAMLRDLEAWIARRAMAGDVADVGHFVRSLYGLELDEPKGPRRLTSGEIAAMLPSFTSSVFAPPPDHPDRPALRRGRPGDAQPSAEPREDTVVRNFGTDAVPVVHQTGEMDSLGAMLDDIFAAADGMDLSAEIPIEVEAPVHGAAPSGEVAAQGRPGGSTSGRVPALPPGVELPPYVADAPTWADGDDASGATQPIALPHDEDVVPEPYQEVPTRELTTRRNGRVPALPPGVELPPYVSEAPTEADHRHQETTREVSLDTLPPAAFPNDLLAAVSVDPTAPASPTERDGPVPSVLPGARIFRRRHEDVDLPTAEIPHGKLLDELEPDRPGGEPTAPLGRRADRATPDGDEATASSDRDP